ncbi:nicotinamide-nucleotide amidase [Ruaniaceae bacterium KH17]|nr:nicotinamide-nucleotide amidase [Ruaniaceae bacterium KH17]
MALDGRTVAVAESLTAGYVSGALATVPGVSAILRGGVVAYSPEIKISLLGVDPDLIAAGGTVQPEVAQQMARGVAERLGAQFGIGTTGVAGPGSAEGHAAGECFVAAVDLENGVGVVEHLLLEGDRDEVRRACSEAALEICARLAEQTRPLGRYTE